LQVASVTAGVRDSEGNKKSGIKKLHSMRGICNDMLVQKGVETSTRRQHLGWTDGSVDDKHYSNSEQAAIASKAPQVLAGDPHNVWTMNLDSMPNQILKLLLPHETSPILVYFRKVVLIALASDMCPASFTQYFRDIYCNSQFKVYKISLKASLKSIPPTPEKKAENVEIANLKRKLVEVTANLNMEKLQNKRLKKLYSRDAGQSDDSESDNDEPRTLDQAKQRLLEITTEVTKSTVLDKNSIGWLKMCHDRVTNDVIPLISKFSKHDAFLFGLSTTPGKRLINLLLLSALYHNSPESVVSDIAKSFTLRQNWLGFVASNKRGPAFNRYHTESWSAFIISSGLDKPMESKEIAI
jgi:hypothetical protein